MLDGLTEAPDAIILCEQEIVLYKDPKLYKLVSDVYVILSELMKMCQQHWSRSDISRLVRLDEDGSDLQEKVTNSMAEIRKLSQAVLRKADYHHRVEMRETSSRIVDMQVEQRKILTTLEDQRRILRSLQEERNIMNVIQEQRKIFQVVKQIQEVMQTRVSRA